MSDPDPRRAHQVAVRILDAAWRRDVPNARALCRRFALAALADQGAPPAELAIVLADDAAVRALNARWRGKDKPTNVLSFPAADADAPLPAAAPLLLGDVVLARETVLGEAAAQGKAPADHLAHLIVHGVLHLLGHDHERTREAERMERRERAILAAHGIADPYAPPRKPAPAGAEQRRRARAA